VNQFRDPGEAYKAGLLAHLRATTNAVNRDPAPVDVRRANAADDAARRLAASSAVFAPAWGMSLRGWATVPLTADGSSALAGVRPTRSVAELVELWRQYPDAPAGVALAASGLVAAALDEDGWEWLRQAAKRDPGDDYRPPTYLDHGGAPLQLVEHRAPTGPMRTLTFYGDGGMKAAADAFGPGSRPRTRNWLLWEQPAGWELPTGRRARGIRLLDVVPADGATVEVDGRTWVAQWPTRPGALPDWLAADVLGGKVRAAA
jgi:hypothetical protein